MREPHEPPEPEFEADLLVVQQLGQGDPVEATEGEELSLPFIYIPDLSSETRWARLIFASKAAPPAPERPRAGFHYRGRA